MGVFLELLKAELSDVHDCSAKSAGFASLLLLCFGWFRESTTAGSCLLDVLGRKAVECASA